MDPYRQTDKALLIEFGNRLRTARLNLNITRDELATRSGVAKGTLRAVEKGANLTMLNLLRILRALQTLDQFDLLLPETGPSPLETAKLQGKQRVRARQRNSMAHKGA